MQVEKPQAVARYALNIETQGLPADFYEKYIQTINNVTADDILRVANKYFLIDNLRIVIAGKGADVIPGLESLKIPIFYYDKYANPIEKPILKKDAPAGVTAQNVLDNYIKAIGSEKAVASVKTISMLGSATIPEAPSPLTFTNKVDSKGKLAVEIKMGPMSLMKQVVNEKGAYVIQQGKRKNIEGKDLVEMKASAVPFEEIQLAKKTDITLTGIESVDGNEAYVIKNGDTTLYYDVKSGLKLAEEKSPEQGDDKLPLKTYYKDYREVKGVKLPFNIIQNAGFELDFKMSEVKVNEGVSDADFK
jgi:hypothetical protein